MRPFYNREGVTIYHGDARRIAASLPQSDLIFADPAYGHNNNNGDLIHHREQALGVGKHSKARPIKNDSPKQASGLAKWLFEFAARNLRCCGCCCCCCCCGGGGPDPQFARWALWMDEHLYFKQLIVWDKGPMGMGWHYRRSYETILVAQKGKGKTRWQDRTRCIENIIRPGDYGIRKIIPHETDHPNVKPVALPALFISLHSRRGDLVLDPFAGTGATLIAARKLGRRSIGIELEKKYCRLAIERLESEAHS